ncbi:MAG: 4Fe-4S dicluster domain-containing protein, partial [Deltaproteobacteria bacterium]|nr:4Fe-4S dicluster domain-containing protein [Deltaproteobacteria bacterium]
RKVHQVEQPESAAKITYVSLSCLHCEDAPCAAACPTGAISKDPASGAVTVRSEVCVGCRTCLLACPFGAPGYGSDGKMQKCDLCSERVASGLEPACVAACPTKALAFGEPNRLAEATQAKYARKLATSRGAG